MKYMSPQDIKAKIEEELPGSKVEVEDPYNDGVHLKAKITYDGFSGKSLIKQHQMVYDILRDSFNQNYLHALNLETLVN